MFNASTSPAVFALAVASVAASRSAVSVATLARNSSKALSRSANCASSSASCASISVNSALSAAGAASATPSCNAAISALAASASCCARARSSVRASICALFELKLSISVAIVPWAAASRPTRASNSACKLTTSAAAPFWLSDCASIAAVASANSVASASRSTVVSWIDWRSVATSVSRAAAVVDSASS